MPINLTKAARVRCCPSVTQVRNLRPRGRQLAPAIARRDHVLPGHPRTWPAFSAGTQGDFACYLLSGIGRLARYLGQSGLIIVLDEMEKWQDLNWQQQSRASNFLGGLIWGATEQDGFRARHTVYAPNPRQPPALQHSGRAGGFPFTTLRRCHTGVLIALTPRGDQGPEATWERFGKFSTVQLPEFRRETVQRIAGILAEDYSKAYSCPRPNMEVVSSRALRYWDASGSASARAALQAVVRALDEWRDSAA